MTSIKRIPAFPGGKIPLISSPIPLFRHGASTLNHSANDRRQAGLVTPARIGGFARAAWLYLYLRAERPPPRSSSSVSWRKQNSHSANRYCLLFAYQKYSIFTLSKAGDSMDNPKKHYQAPALTEVKFEDQNLITFASCSKQTRIEGTVTNGCCMLVDPFGSTPAAAFDPS